MLNPFFRTLVLSACGLFAALGTATAEPTKVGFVYLTSPGDHGWTYAHEVARQMVVAHFGAEVETTVVENITEGPDATRVIRELALGGNDIIFTTSFGYMNQTVQVAREFPDIKFEHITGFMRGENLATGNIRFYEGRFVQGVVAGLMTESNRIGYIAAFPIPEVIMGINAFARGLRSTNPDATISVIWVNTWYDPVKESDAAKVHIAQGADILAQHTDSPAMLQIAEREGVLGFGQSTDMAAFAPKAQLFASINNWGPYYIARIEALRDGSWQESDTWGGFDADMLKLSAFTNMPPTVADQAQAAFDGIKDGTIEVFAGPIRDNTGREVVAAGETLDDAGLWAMDYYVEGVGGTVPQ